jgi:hypothetical protein
MMSRDDGLCFLTGVQGKFMGGGERVAVELHDNTWYLTGQSLQEGVRADAVCYTWYSLSASQSDLSGPYIWLQGESPVRMTPANNSVCFLMAVRGKFIGGGESIQIVERDSYWSLEGYSSQIDLQGVAGCLSGREVVDYYTLESGQSPVRLPSTGVACFLAQVRGSFRGAGERLEIYDYDGSWRLGGQYLSGQGVWGAAVCSPY